jgi:hypothetical protein
MFIGGIGFSMGGEFFTEEEYICKCINEKE